MRSQNVFMPERQFLIKSFPNFAQIGQLFLNAFKWSRFGTANKRTPPELELGLAVFKPKYQCSV
jgi:hypothetical protein